MLFFFPTPDWLLELLISSKIQSYSLFIKTEIEKSKYSRVVGRHVKVGIIIREFTINFTSLFSIENGVPLIQWIFNTFASLNAKQDLPDVSPSGNKTADKSQVSFWLSSTIINHQYFTSNIFQWIKKNSLLLVTNTEKKRKKKKKNMNDRL